MQIRYGFRMSFDCALPTPAIFAVDLHPSRQADMLSPASLILRTDKGARIAERREVDLFGNIRRHALLPAGKSIVERDGLLADSGRPDSIAPEAGLTPIERLPQDVAGFLLPSRYCESDLLAGMAWRNFGSIACGWERVQAICDFVHSHIEFGYGHADVFRSAKGALEERRGVCRDFAHLSVALCRAVNVPARYCTGYLGDIGVPRDPAPMDFSAWFEAYIGGRWFSFDARHNVPRIGRIVMARGRDAADVPIVSTFGAHRLDGFTVWTDEVEVARIAAE